MKKTMRITEIMADFLDSIRDYEHESGEAIYYDERDSSEFVDIFFNEGDFKVEEKKEPLFTTEDGVGVKFFSQLFWVVNKKDFRKTRCTVLSDDVTRDWYVFYHKENADEYIWKNKPVFSYEDFIKWGNPPYQRVIEQLAKERI